MNSSEPPGSSTFSLARARTRLLALAIRRRWDDDATRMLNLSDSELARVRTGEIVSTLTALGRGVTELIAYGQFQSPPAQVWKILDDVENYPTTMPKVKISKLIERHAHGLRMRMVIDSPFPLPDISSTYDSVHTAADGVWKREWQQVDKGLAPNSGSWVLVAMPGDDTRTLAQYRVKVTPLIPIPKRIIQFAHNRVIPMVFRSVDLHAGKLSS